MAEIARRALDSVQLVGDGSIEEAGSNGRW